MQREPSETAFPGTEEVEAEEEKDEGGGGVLAGNSLNDTDNERSGEVSDAESDSWLESLGERVKRHAAELGYAGLAGFGMFSEAYMLFAIGNVEPIWELLYPSCYQYSNTSCDSNLANSLSYVETSLIIVGMLGFGMLASTIGRKWGSRSTSSIMFVGGIITVAANGPNSSTALFIWLAVGIGIFSIGVGGEYSVAASSAAERSEANRINKLRKISQATRLQKSLEHLVHDAAQKRPASEVLMYKEINRLEKATQRDIRRATEDLGLLAAGKRENAKSGTKSMKKHLPKIPSEREVDATDFQTEGPEQQHHGEQQKPTRGRAVVLVFAMQGWGNVFNVAIILLTLSLTPSADCTPSSSDPLFASPGSTCNPDDLNLVWRMQYLIGVIAILFMVIGRFLFLGESQIWKERQEAVSKLSKHEVREQRKRRTQVLRTHNWSRLLGTSASWFLMDVVLYGNKFFQGTIISTIIGGTPSLRKTLQYTLLNSFIGLIGYYFSAYTIDRSWLGRRRLQALGFMMMTITFLISSYANAALTKEENIWAYELLYFLSTFFTQFGPNCTTFLIPAEVFPTDVRTQAHGISAASGKTGALVATLVFSLGANGHPVAPVMIFEICGWISLVGLIFTLCFIPDVTTLDLSEIDRRFEFQITGRGHLYQGAATDTKHLSLVERWLLRREVKLLANANIKRKNSDPDTIEDGDANGDGAANGNGHGHGHDDTEPLLGSGDKKTTQV